MSADIFCDRCGNWENGLTGGVNERLAARVLILAKKRGWSRSSSSVYLDLCSHCLEEFRRLPNPKENTCDN
jgi:hypothetical protein